MFKNLIKNFKIKNFSIFLLILVFFLFFSGVFHCGEAKTRSSTKSLSNKAKAKTIKKKSSLDTVKYKVKKGDTLFSIARKFNVSVEDLMKINNLKTTSLTPGQVLIVSKVKEVRKNVENDLGSSDFYVVKKGDTLFSIAKKFGVSVEEIKRANNLSGNDLKVGQVLKISALRVLKNEDPRVNLRKVLSSEVRENVDQNLDYIWHKVKEGETLYNLSLRYGVPVEEIKKANNLEENIIIVGQVLKVPVYKKDSFKLENPIKKFEEISKEKNSLSVKFSDLFLTKSILDKDEEKALKDKFIEIAEQFKSFGYKMGGSGNGYLDCSMFVKLVFEDFGINLPRTSREQFEIGIEVSRDELIPGDLVFFSRNGRKEGINHVGIYIGNNKFIHFSSSRKGLAIDSLESDYFKKRFIGAKRVLKNGIFFYLFEKDLGDIES